jgi:hypothetical protein
MIQFEYMPVVIEAHRNDLRRLYEPLPPELPRPSRRERLGARIVTLGHWVGNTCRDIATEPRIPTTGREAAA